MYVWVDALTNYLTGVGYPDETATVAALLARRRAPDRQGHRPLPRGLLAGVPDVGRDLPLPKQVFGHGFLLSRGREDVEERSATSSIRSSWPSASGSTRCAISCCAKSRFGQDGSYSAEAIVSRVNAELANSFGNLAQRSLSMIFKNWTAFFRPTGEATEDDGACSTLVDDALATSCPRRSSSWPSRPGSRRGWARCSPATPMSTRRRRGRCARPIPSGWRRCWHAGRRASASWPMAVAPVIPTSAAQAARRLIDSGERTGSADRASRQPDLPAARAGGADEAARLMLIDSHCHLNYDGLVERPGRSARRGPGARA